MRYLNDLLAGVIRFIGGQYSESVAPSLVRFGNRLTFSHNDETKTTEVNVSDYVITELQEAAPRWRTILDIDFATLGSQVFNGSGNVELGAQTFVVENFANIYANSTHAMGIVNGQGLVLPGQSTANLNNYVANRTAPLIRWKFPSFINNKTPIRAACKMGTGVTSDGATDGPRMYLGIEYPRSTYRYQRAMYVNMRSGVSTFTIVGNVSVCASAQAVSGQGTIASSDMFGVTCPEGVGPMCRHSVQSGSSVTHYTALGSMRQLDDKLAAFSANSLIVTDEVSVGSDWGVALSYCDTGISTSFYVTVRKLKVEAFY